MEQIPQSIINSILGGALAALGWFARQIWGATPVTWRIGVDEI